MLAGTSHNPSYGPWPADDLAPTLTTTSHLWCMSAGRYREAWAVAALLGFTTRELVLNGQTEALFRKCSGLAAQVPNFAVALATVMAHPLAACLGVQCWCAWLLPLH